LDSN